MKHFGLFALAFFIFPASGAGITSDYPATEPMTSIAKEKCQSDETYDEEKGKCVKMPRGSH